MCCGLEAWALRALFAVDHQDELALKKTLAEFTDCENCTGGVIVCLATTLIGSLDACDATSRDGTEWRTVLADRLADVLDKLAASK